MKIRTWTVSLAVLVAGVAKADTTATGWSYDQNVKGVAFASDCCEPECGAADSCCADPCCGTDCGDGCGCGAGVGGFTLASLIGLPASSPYQIGGWTEMAYMDNNVPLSQAYNDLLSFDDVPDHLHLGQQWFYIGKTVDGSAGLDVGGRIDTVYGTDAQKTQAFGNPGAGVRGFGTFDASLDHGEYGWAIPQAYGEFAVGDLSVKVGHFFTLQGYEVIPVTGNFFRSHSYTMFNSEPFTHTGVLGTYAMSEKLSVMAGWVLGWDTGFDQLNSGNALHSGFSYAINDAVTFTYMTTYGNFGWRDGGDDNSLSGSAVVVASLTDNLQYIAQVDHLDTSNPGVSEFDTIGLNQYLLYSLNDVVGIGGRLEWWKADGVSFYEATSGLNIKLTENTNIRPEYRQDWAPGIGLDEDTFMVDGYVTY